MLGLVRKTIALSDQDCKFVTQWTLGVCFIFVFKKDSFENSQFVKKYLIFLQPCTWTSQEG